MPERADADAYIGLGANLEDPRRQVEAAIGAIARLPQSRLLAASPCYRTAPLGPLGQPDYINAVVRIRTALAPDALLAALQGIEQRHGRLRDGPRWGPRTLDLDLLLHGERVIRTGSLTLPHPAMHQRAFVLVPLADVAPADLQIPGHGPLAALLAAIGRDGILALAGDAAVV